MPGLRVIRMQDVDLRNKRVLIREDLNVPVANGAITSDARIRASLPTIRLALDAGARVIILSHLGRPTEGKPDPASSLGIVATRLSELLGKRVPLVTDWLGSGSTSGSAAAATGVARRSTAASPMRVASGACGL